MPAYRYSQDVIFVQFNCIDGARGPVSEYSAISNQGGSVMVVAKDNGRQLLGIFHQADWNVGCFGCSSPPACRHS